ncbi:uncharacterized protein LOC107359738 isoform X2 [Tetranychus urticae]|uniref:Secreted protein n=1 Tax=Tetranychus urticae TaxID=32264 RepID=T1JT91_TETUR|nr:uncharacterized protein LOC107359738 isoform X1 [Tetranychus urticae]XP_015781783.1 uncharacterized protein LOC107359738 isoform X2 [Tetranychus urticae]
MRFLVILSLALCIGFAYGASVNRSKRDIQQDMQNIIAEIQKNGIGAVGGKIAEFAKTFQDQIKTWHCPNIGDYLQAIQSGDAGKVAQTLFGSAVCTALHLQ